MTKPITYRFFSVVLACMVFISTSMQSMSLHYCKGELAGIGLFQQDFPDSSCCDAHSSKCQKSSQDNTCCKDEFLDLDWKTDMAVSGISIDTDQVTDCTNANLDIIVCPQAKQSILPKNYIPPLLTENFQVRFEQFLI